MKHLLCLIHTILGHRIWNAVPEGRMFVWRRYVCAAGSWERREMTDDEQEDAIAFWSIR